MSGPLVDPAYDRKDMPRLHLRFLFKIWIGLARHVQEGLVPRIFRMLNPADHQGSGPGTAQKD